MKKNKEYSPPSPEVIKKATKTVAVTELKRLLKNMDEQKAFSIDDVLVKRDRKSGSIMMNGGNPKRWIVSHKDEDGLIYARRILISGKLGSMLTCLTVDWTSTYTYDIDPGYIDNVLLDTEDAYNPFDEARRQSNMKAKVRAENKKKKANVTYFKGLNVGDKLWTSGNMLGDNIIEWSIIKISNIAATKDRIIHIKTLTGGKQPITKYEISRFYKEEPTKLEQL